MSSGINRARFISDLDVEEGSERHHEILRSQLSLVNDNGQMREDAPAVRKQVYISRCVVPPASCQLQGAFVSIGWALICRVVTSVCCAASCRGELGGC